MSEETWLGIGLAVLILYYLAAFAFGKGGWFRKS